MNKLLVTCAAILLFSACQTSDFEREFECSSPRNFTNTKTYKDVLKHFEIEIPKSWKTELYYDEYQSKLYTADTTKQLRETYILDFTWHQGELMFDKDFETTVTENAINKMKLIPVKSGYGEFLDKPSYYQISTAKSDDLSWHYLEIYVRFNVDEYYTFTAKIYGSEFVSDRICSSLSLFKSIEFLD